MKHYYVVEVEYIVFNETDVIGVADSRENYIKLINDYFGDDLSRKVKESDLRLVEESGVEATLQVIDQEGEEYPIYISYHRLNEI